MYKQNKCKPNVPPVEVYQRKRFLDPLSQSYQCKAKLKTVLESDQILVEHIFVDRCFQTGLLCVWSLTWPFGFLVCDPAESENNSTLVLLHDLYIRHRGSQKATSVHCIQSVENILYLYTHEYCDGERHAYKEEGYDDQQPTKASDSACVFICWERKHLIKGL